MRDFVKSAFGFSSALVVYGVSQTVNVFRGLPTKAPTQTATRSFEVTTAALKTQFDSLDNTIYNTVDTVQNVFIDLFFNFFTANTFNPKTVWETSVNVTKASLGLAEQLIPGGKIGTGGPPQGWGPVNNQDAELFQVTPSTTTSDPDALDKQYQAAVADQSRRPVGAAPWKAA
jgi:hypothetical protein